MNIEDKFRQGKNTLTYLRVDPKFRVDTYLGYNDDKQMSMVITEYGLVNKVSSSKQIDVSAKRREDGKTALEFKLLNKQYSSLFMLFCNDMITYVEVTGKEKAISEAVKRWKYWNELFKKQTSQLLSKQEIKGLIGELIFLNKLIDHYGSTLAVQSWMGPLSGHKDFEIKDTWYEIKSIRESALQIEISSLEQLDSNEQGHLIIFRLEDSNPSADDTISLNRIVLETSSRINDMDVLDLFQNRLYSVGYFPDDAYESICFKERGMTSYRVDKNFPKLTRDNVPVQIGNSNYTLLINGLDKYVEDDIDEFGGV